MTNIYDDGGSEPKTPGFRPRRSARIAVDSSASLTPQSRYEVEIKIRDVSTTGFMAECAERVLIGSYVSLEIPGIGPVHAQVRWQLGPTMGGMFLDPISLKRCEWTAVRSEEAA
jgi:hypothetical protein